MESRTLHKRALREIVRPEGGSSLYSFPPWLTSEPKPVFIEVLRCIIAFALIDAGGGLSGYVLEKYVPFENEYLRYTTLFNIETKFHYTSRETIDVNAKKTGYIDENQ